MWSVARSSLCNGLTVKATMKSGCTLARVQLFASRVRSVAPEARTARRRTLKEIVMAPAGESAFNLGKGALAGASAIGLGTLCFYGLGMSKGIGAIDRSMLWPPVVKERIRSTYMYLGGGLLLTAASAVAVSRRPRLLAMMANNSWVAIGCTFAAMIGSGALCRSLPYTPDRLGAKHLAWALHTGIMGAVVAPLCFLGGPLLVRAAWYTAGIIGGLSIVAACAPSDKFLNMGGPLAIGLGVVFVSSLGSMFLPPATALGAGLYSMSLYGGLILFSLFLLYDTQKIIRAAEMHPTYGLQPYDPINRSMGVYMDTLNIFIRIATILGGGGGRRK